MRTRGLHLLLLLALLPSPRAAVAQGPGSGFSGTPAQKRAGAWEPPRFHVGGALTVAEPEGPFAEVVGTGWGIDLNGRYALDPEGVLGLRVDIGFVEYGRETRQVCFSATVGCRVVLDLTTSNTILSGGFGPEVALPGRGVRPYAYGQLGFAYFSTTSRLRGTADVEDFASTENFGDGTLAWRMGGGMQIRLSGGRTPVWLDLGADYNRNGVVEYLTEGDIRDNPDGSITVFPNRSEANLTTFRIGVTVGIRGGRGRHRDGFRHRR